MPKALVECVPNFSEARRPEVVEAIAKSIGAVPGIRLLDRHSDLDHNRSVITFIGPPQAVEEAAFRCIAKAAELINLDQHTGEHPRIGATDVMPFVPIAGISMADCVQMARRLGKRVGEELGIPVYLYEQAATRPERQNLENIRRGQYENLKQEIGTNPEREPDFGPAQLGAAGATVIGARPFLVAYNVYLTSSDVAIAEKIARAVRHSSGGLRYVKALGLLVDGRAQVSMNLTDFHKTPIARVVELIRREAARYGTGIHHSELVGLTPEAALVDAAVWYLQMDQFESGQVLESRLYALDEDGSSKKTENAQQPLPSLLTENFLEDLASASPAPGGGSASACAGAMGAALAAMVARVTLGKKKYAAVEAEMQSIIEKADALREELTQAVAQDAAAFETVMAAMKMPKSSQEQELARADALEIATLNAAEVPLEVARSAVEVLELAAQVIAKGNLNAISDGGSGAALARAALSGAGLNVRINLNTLRDPAAGKGMLEQLQKLEKRAASLEAKIQSDLSSRGGIGSE